MFDEYLGYFVECLLNRTIPAFYVLIIEQYKEILAENFYIISTPDMPFQIISSFYGLEEEFFNTAVIVF